MPGPGERGRPTLKSTTDQSEEARADFHRPALTDSRIFTLEEVSTLDDPSHAPLT